MPMPSKAAIAERLVAKPSGFLDCGYHGTSLDALWRLIHDGFMPSDGTSGDDLFIFRAPFETGKNHDAWDAAAAYASDQGYWLHPASARFGITIQEVILVGTGEPGAPTSVTENELDAFRCECRQEQRRGVVLGLRRWCRPLKGRIHRTDQGNELRVQVPGGVPWSAIRLICPLGAYEKRALDELVQAGGS